LIFVCHGLGGQIAKLAYLESARSTPPYARLRHRLSGILFFATPHDGSSRDWNNLLETCHHGKLSSPDAKFVAREMCTITERFTEVSKHLRLHSLCETQPVRIFGKKTIIVDGSHAKHMLDCVDFTLLDANHHNICKYESPNSQNYQHVRELLVNFTLGAIAKARAGS
jgi:hypothetical protein